MRFGGSAGDCLLRAAQRRAAPQNRSLAADRARNTEREAHRPSGRHDARLHRNLEWCEHATIRSRFRADPRGVAHVGERQPTSHGRHSALDDVGVSQGPQLQFLQKGPSGKGKPTGV
eukprot:5119680-Prymnesium_polylepis.1